MKEEFVTFKQAKSLYNLDFDWDCGMAYFDRPWNHEHRLVHYTIADKERRNYDGTDVYPAPTQALAQKWMREVKGIDIIVTLFRDIDARVEPPQITRSYEVEICIGEDDECAGEYFPTYESALATGLDAALELIKQK